VLIAVMIHDQERPYTACRSIACGGDTLLGRRDFASLCANERVPE
jgi:hypothetical protein